MVSSGTRKSRLLSRSRCLLLLVLLPFGLAAPSLHGQTQTTHTWNGGVETCVPPGPNAGRPTGTAECSWPSTTLTVNRGDSATYYLRLTASPTADNWWVMLRVKNSEGDVLLDGESSGGVRWVPSIGREIHQHNWNQWHSVSVRADDDAELSTLTFDHEVWDDDAECPVHDAAPVTVRVVAKDSDDGGEDGGDNGGEDNGGEDNGEDNGGEDNGGGNGGEDNGGGNNGEDNGGEDTDAGDDTAPVRMAVPKIEEGDRILTVSWTEPASERSIVYYEVRYKAVDATTWEPENPMAVTAMATQIKDLTNGTAYLAQVRAVDSAGAIGEWSEPGSGTPKAMEEEEGEEPMPTPALPVFGALALGAGLLAAGWARTRYRGSCAQASGDDIPTR